MFGSAKKDKEGKSGSRDKSVDKHLENVDKEDEKKESKKKNKLKLIKHKADKSSNLDEKSMKKHQQQEQQRQENLYETNEHSQIFGVTLELAAERHKSHDGIPLPVIVRMCVDYIEEEGLMQEGIYRSSGVKSKINKLKSLFNSPAGRAAVNLKV